MRYIPDGNRPETTTTDWVRLIALILVIACVVWFVRTLSQDSQVKECKAQYVHYVSGC